MPPRSSVRIAASLAATVACLVPVIGCASAAGVVGAGRPAATTRPAAGGQPAVVGQPAIVSRPATASPPAAADRTARPTPAVSNSRAATTRRPAGTSPSAAASPAGEQYYLALGDSLAEGYQPDQTTGEGYPNQLDALLRAHGSVLSLDNLGCGGETTQTLIEGGICSYPGGPNQLQAALAFLHAHPGAVPLITINIGGNDVTSCGNLTSVSSADAYTEAAMPAMNSNLTAALTALRAADPSGVIVGLNYYVPELAEWLSGSSGQTAAAAQLAAGKVLNAALAADYQAAGALYADVFAKFQSDDLTDRTTLPGYGSVPVAVAMVCTWTWMCSEQDEHANTAGYGAIAAAVDAVLPASIAG